MKKYILILIPVFIGLLMMSQPMALRKESIAIVKNHFNSVKKMTPVLAAQQPKEPLSSVVSEEAILALSQSWSLQHKAILSREESHVLESIISNPKIIKESAALLKSAQWTSLESAQAMKRLQAINLLEASMRCHADSIKQIASQEIQSVLLSNNHFEDLDSKAKRILLGDHIDLFRILLEYDPQQADAIEKSGASASQKKIFAYARSLHRRNRT